MNRKFLYFVFWYRPYHSLLQGRLLSNIFNIRENNHDIFRIFLWLFHLILFLHIYFSSSVIALSCCSIFRIINIIIWFRFLMLCYNLEFSHLILVFLCNDFIKPINTEFVKGSQIICSRKIKFQKLNAVLDKMRRHKLGITFLEAWLIT